ncbi:hypothetical protein GF325_02560 [Candidatus Bathyarchaeota archaeon]|nr:hypothetical protein [Candidatus Bathyarchaeota archaeon]
METIHAVAWCIIINGIIQGLLSRNDGFKKVKRNIKIYALLAVIVVVMTPLVWAGLDRFIANGNFSSGIDPGTGHGWQYGDLIDGSLWKNISRVFLSALGGNVEPIFPFLAVSFVGSIIGLYIMKQSSIQGEKSTRPLKKGMMAAFIMVCIGLVGCIAVLLISGGDTVDNALTLLQNSDSMPQLQDTLGIAWFFMFILLTGSQIGCMLLIFRLVEFRGKAEAFGKKTLFFRRFGFVAFSVYNFQFVDVIPVLIVGLLIPGIPGTIQGVYQSLNVITIWLAILLIIAFWMLLLKIWEKVHYTFSLEWFIAKLSMVLIPINKREMKTQVQWWKTPRLDPVAALHEVEWLDVNTREGMDHGNLKESKLSRQLAYCGWLFFPAFFISFGISRSSAKKEDTNKINRQAKIISIIGIAWVLSFAVVTSLLPIGLIL